MGGQCVNLPSIITSILTKRNKIKIKMDGTWLGFVVQLIHNSAHNIIKAMQLIKNSILSLGPECIDKNTTQ